MSDSTVEATFRLPDLGEGLVEAEILDWHVAPGDRVVADQPLVTVETDKAVVDIPAPETAHILSIEAAVGDRVLVGDPLVRFRAEGAERAHGSDTGTVVGELPEARPLPASTGVPDHRGGKRPLVKASPRARRRARELGVDLAGVTRTAERVSLRDVERSGSTSATIASPLTGTRRDDGAAYDGRARARRQVDSDRRS